MALATAKLLTIWLFTASCLLVLMHNAALDREKFSWLRYVAMAFLLKHLVWLDRGAFLRACSKVFLLGTVLLLASRWRWRISIFATPIAR